jgi:hypothetical protein
MLEKTGQDFTLQPTQVRPKTKLSRTINRESEGSASGYAADLIAGLQNLPQPLQEALAPFLEDETFRSKVERTV